MADDIKALELKIRELENQLKQFQAASAPQALTREEVAAYQKVKSVLSFADDWGCGINECRPLSICRICGGGGSVCRICRICINECICGPCNICGIGGAGGGFSGFGG